MITLEASRSSSMSNHHISLMPHHLDNDQAINSFVWRALLSDAACASRLSFFPIHNIPTFFRLVLNLSAKTTVVVWLTSLLFKFSFSVKGGSICSGVGGGGHTDNKTYVYVSLSNYHLSVSMCLKCCLLLYLKLEQNLSRSYASWTTPPQKMQFI